MFEPGFSELAVDLYEEVLRRKANETLNPHENYHSKRNETRIRLASAHISKVKTLVSDVYHELDRRFPELKTLPRT
ncbi:hypothetical protein Clacol_004185 [Clathrus columnatus]|uniref:Uncharacterized protein n=1 Tax=Clathrus columnatus TaxID=1419009 RepID=A0AAV5A6Q6_9AGAM|nr:hypothetical protein Clacol_004185 [Clathrus columnatus]